MWYAVGFVVYNQVLGAPDINAERCEVFVVFDDRSSDFFDRLAGVGDDF